MNASSQGAGAHPAEKHPRLSVRAKLNMTERPGEIVVMWSKATGTRIQTNSHRDRRQCFYKIRPFKSLFWDIYKYIHIFIAP